MRLHLHLTSIAILAAALTLAPSPSWAQVPAASSEKKAAPGGGMFDSLAGPGGSVRFVTRPGRDGKAVQVRGRTTEDGAFAGLEAAGDLLLETPTFKLRCENLNFDGQAQTIKAWGNVVVDQQGLKATCGRMNYDIGTKTILLTESPVVEQMTEQNVTRFKGMETFRIIQKADGSSEVAMEGTEQMEMEILPKNAPAATPTPTPAATPKTTSQAPKGAASGLGAIGNSVRLRVSPRGNEAPLITSTLGDAGLETFRATGSIRLSSDKIDLRSDKLEFLGPEQQLVAMSNVFLKQEGIDADCGKLVYELGSEIITLSVNPVVRQKTDSGRTTISDIQSFIIRRQMNGEVFTEMVNGPATSPSIVHQQATPTPGPATATQQGPIEINMQDTSVLGKQQQQPVPQKPKSALP